MSDDCKMRWIRITDKFTKQVIPKGVYCYDENGVCPFWDMVDNFPKQSNGYCHYLEKGDWMKNSTSLLWDQCKECGINDEIEEEI